jgi:uncharacterized protein (TIGR02677 family)
MNDAEIEASHNLGTKEQPGPDGTGELFGDLSGQLLSVVSEMRYLTTDQADTRRPFYRVIMRFLYAQAQIPRDWITTKEIRDHVALRLRQRDYSEEDCDRDLRWLQENDNVISEQRSLEGRVMTVEEFQRGRLVYQITQTSMQIERLLVSLEQQNGSRGSIDQSLLQSLWVQLENLRAAMEERPAEPGRDYLLARIHRVWDDAFTSFTKLRNNTIDFHNALHRIRPEEMEDVQAFLGYKDLLIQNLRGFINDLLLYAPKVRSIFEEMEREGMVQQMITDLTTARTRFIATAEPPDPRKVQTDVQQQVAAVRGWFQSGGSVDVLRTATQDSVRVILKLMARLLGRHRVQVSRQRDLETIARRFQRCETVEDANRLASRTLGWANPRHLQGTPPPAGSVEASLSPWQLEPTVEALQVRQRGRKARGKTASVRDVAAEQARVILQEQERRRAIARQWDALFVGGEINIGTLHVEDEQICRDLLRALSQCLASPTRMAPTLDGRMLRLLTPLDPEDSGEFVTPHGVLLTPKYRLQLVGA